MPAQLNTKMKTKIMNLKIDNNNKTAELVLYGDIGDSFWEDISSKEIVHSLENLEVDNITININSNGGGTTAAIAISNVLKRHKAKTTAYIDGIVASAATIITSACDVVKMPKNALFMIHNPWTVAAGDEKDFEKMAETLSKVKNSIMETYVSKTGLDKEKLSELMDKESWFSATEAKEYGFIDEIIENTDIETVNNKVLSNGMVFNMTGFKNFKLAGNINNKNKEEDIVNKEEFKEKYPGIYNEIVNEGKELERNRIKELEELGIESETVNKAKFETLQNASEIAIDLIKELNNKVNIIPEPSNGNTAEDYRNQNPPMGTIPAVNKSEKEKDEEEAERILAFIKGGIK